MCGNESRAGDEPMVGESVAVNSFADKDHRTGDVLQ